MEKMSFSQPDKEYYLLVSTRKSKSEMESLWPATIAEHIIDREEPSMSTPAKEPSTQHQKSSFNRQFRRQPISLLSLHILTKIALQQDKKPSGRQGPTCPGAANHASLGRS
ncbi:hypothetical protein V8C44DRAFT_331973 [Trichoderma aethiopicum]